MDKNFIRSPEPRYEETKRLGRVLRIVQIIASQPSAWSRQRLADCFEVSTRQIDKDLELIRNALRYELRRSTKGYFFQSGPTLRAIQLDLPEALGLSLAAQQALETGTAERASIISAMNKIENTLPSDLMP